MTEPGPDFILSLEEGRDDAAPLRKCWLIRRMVTEDGGRMTLVSIAPPLIGQPYGLGDRDIDHVLLQDYWDPRSDVQADPTEGTSVRVFITTSDPPEGEASVPAAYFGIGRRVETPWNESWLSLEEDGAGAFFTHLGHLYQGVPTE